MPLSTVLSAFATLVALATSVVLFFARAAVTGREKEIDRRLESGASKMDAIDARLHTEEKSTIRQDGQIERLRDTHSNVAADVEEIKRLMVTKAEWFQMEKALERLAAAVEGRRYTPMATQQYSPGSPTGGPPKPTK